MIRFYIFLVLNLFYNPVFSQTICKGILLDSITKQVIEFANIGIIGKGVGTVTDEKGEYNFSVPDSLINEQIKISMLGYRSKIISAKDLRNQKIMSLGQSATVLTEVDVSIKKSKVKVVGNETKTKRVSAGFKNNSLGAEIGIKISVKHAQTHIRKLMFNINANKLDVFPMFRFNMYTVDKNGYPGENMLHQNIIIIPATKTGYIEFDLVPYKIFVDDDVFISIEWIKDLGNVKGLYFSTKLIGNSTYFRQTSQAKWEKINSIGIGLHTEIAY